MTPQIAHVVALYDAAENENAEQAWKDGDFEAYAYYTARRDKLAKKVLKLYRKFRTLGQAPATARRFAHMRATQGESYGSRNWTFEQAALHPYDHALGQDK